MNYFSFDTNLIIALVNDKDSSWFAIIHTDDFLESLSER